MFKKTGIHLECFVMRVLMKQMGERQMDALQFTSFGVKQNKDFIESGLKFLPITKAVETAKSCVSHFPHL